MKYMPIRHIASYKDSWSRDKCELHDLLYDQQQSLASYATQCDRDIYSMIQAIEDTRDRINDLIDDEYF